MIEVEKLSRAFGTLMAVNEVSFSVGEGELFGFLGPNGAGKTTTVNMLITLLRPTSGHARLAGLDIVKQASDVRRAIGVIFQEPSLDERLTALDNMRLHAFLYRVPGSEREKRIQDLLEMVGLTARRADTVKTFSGGMKRRLEIARGLLHKPKVLFLDEPTQGLDPQTRQHIWKYLGQLRSSQKTTILMTTHSMDEAERCDRVAIIDSGRIVELDTPRAIKERHNVATMEEAFIEITGHEIRDGD